METVLPSSLFFSSRNEYELDVIVLPWNEKVGPPNETVARPMYQSVGDSYCSSAIHSSLARHC